MSKAVSGKAVEEVTEEKMFVTISIGEDKFGIDVTKIQEIIGMPEMANVPNAQKYMKGVANLRGRVIPLIDLRVKFKMPEKEYDKLTVVMIAEIKGVLIGLIVDSVSDVMNIPISEIQDTPHFASDIETDCISGMGKVGEEIVIIIDVNKIFTDDEIEAIQK